MFSVVRVGDGRRVVLHLVGELDSTGAPELRDALTEVVGGDGDHVVLDCTELTEIGSAGIALLLTAFRRLHAEGRTIHVVGTSVSVRRTLEVTGLLRSLGRVDPTQPG